MKKIITCIAVLCSGFGLSSAFANTPTDVVKIDFKNPSVACEKEKTWKKYSLLLATLDQFTTGIKK